VDHGHSDHDHHDHGDHGHGHAHHSHVRGAAPQALTRALVITLAFMVVEVVGGVFANSLALVSDAAHMLTDAGALMLALFVYWLARRPSTPSMSFGYHRVEILGALASGLSIWVIAGFLVYEAIVRIGQPPEVRGPVVLAVAALGLGANLLSMKLLSGAREDNINVRAAYLHLLSDSLGSVGAMVAGAVIWWTGWRAIDPIVTLLVAALMLFSSWALIRESIGVLMESTPVGVDPKAVGSELSRLPGVTEVHDLHIWSVSSGRSALSVHLIAADSEGLLSRANELLRERFGIKHTTIQVEHPDRFDSERCYDCQS
jgi:cobalt-zinc-cadmium efflux system protein